MNLDEAKRRACGMATSFAGRIGSGDGPLVRVDGRATVERSDVDGTVAVVVEVVEAFIHCAKAVRRAGLWAAGGLARHRRHAASGPHAA